MVGDEHFLARWSRRKQDERERRDDTSSDTSGESGESGAAADTEASAEAPVEIAPEDLPDIDSLEKDSDFTVFMREGVPEELKRRALRKLWTTDPIFAGLDGLNDYDDDYGAILKQGAELMRRFAAADAAEEEAEERRAAEAGEKTEAPADSDETDAGAADESTEPVAAVEENAGDAAAESGASEPDGDVAENSPGDSNDLSGGPRTDRG